MKPRHLWGLVGSLGAFGLVLMLGLTGCGKDQANGPTAVCTTGMVADIVRNVAGDRVKVIQLLGEGSDPHQYDMTPADAQQLKNASLIFYNGLHLEGKASDQLAKMLKGKSGAAVAEGIDKGSLLDGDEGQHDPHLWFDVSLWIKATDVVCEALVKYDPAHADEFKANAKAYKEKLEKLHQYAKDELDSIPKERRVLVTAHDAFRYFGRAYAIEVRGLQGISTVDEAGIKERNDLVRFITERKIKAVFTESSVPPENIRALREDCEKKGHNVETGGELFSDAMDAPDEPGGTYEGMIRHNVDTIVRALK